MVKSTQCYSTPLYRLFPQQWVGVLWAISGILAPIMERKHFVGYRKTISLPKYCWYRTGKTYILSYRNYSPTRETIWQWMQVFLNRGVSPVSDSISTYSQYVFKTDTSFVWWHSHLTIVYGRPKISIFFCSLWKIMLFLNNSRKETDFWARKRFSQMC